MVEISWILRAMENTGNINAALRSLMVTLRRCEACLEFFAFG
jgi:hypothetical protein